MGACFRETGNYLRFEETLSMTWSRIGGLLRLLAAYGLMAPISAYWRQGSAMVTREEVCKEAG